MNNHEFYENLTPQSAKQLIENWKQGKPNKVGPQNHQRVAEGPLGQTTLFTEPTLNFRDIDALLKEKEKAAAAAAAAAAAPKS